MASGGFVVPMWLPGCNRRLREVLVNGYPWIALFVSCVMIIMELLQVVLAL